MMTQRLERRFLHMAKQIWSPETPLVVGISGGIDSMALYALLKATQNQWPVLLHPVHVNHRLRKSADSEAHWLKNYLWKRFQARLEVLVVDIERKTGESMEMAARRVRYQALEGVLPRFSRDGRIVVGHQQNDQAETVLMRILSGTGIRGIAAMKASSGCVVRPLLTFTREELRQYLEESGIAWQEDPSNADSHMLRNRIRLGILPLLKDAVNPQVSCALAQLADRARAHTEALDFLLDRLVDADQLQESADRWSLPKEWSTWPTEVVTALFRRFGETHGLRLTARHMQQALKGHTDWPKRYRVTHYLDGSLQIAPAPKSRTLYPSDQKFPIKLPITGDLAWNGGIIRVLADQFEGIIPTGWVAIDRESWPELWVRPWHDGDRIQPLGMQGHHKKIQDVWTDLKMGAHWRRRWPLILGGPGGPILSVANLMVSEECRASRGASVYLVRFQYGPAD